jgi:hypothetical protein
VAITYTPTSPLPDEEVTLTLTSGIGTAAEFSITSVPSGSEVDTGLLVDGAGDATPLVTFDVPGAYGVTAYDYLEINGVQRFPFDPAGRVRRRLVATQTGTIYVAELLDIPIRTIVGDGATLRLKVANTTIVSASFVDPLTELGRTAALNSTVVASLATLAGTTASTLSALEVAARDMHDVYGRHRVFTTGSVHAAADTVNATTLDTAYSTRSARDVLNHVYDKFSDHMLADVAHSWHTRGDTKNTFIIGKATDWASTLVLRCDMHRVYEGHRAQTSAPTVHGGTDSTNTLAALNVLETVIRDYLNAIITTSPSIPSGEQTAVEYLKTRFGAKAAR